jgi:hypothetical protein
MWAALLLLALQDTTKPEIPDVGINTGPVAFAGVKAHVIALYSPELKLSIPDVDDAGAHLHYDHKQIDAYGVGGTADFGLVRAGLDLYYGWWRGEGTLTDAGGSRQVPIAGTLFGTEVSAYLPVLSFKSPAFDIALGPQIGVQYQRETLGHIRGTGLRMEDTVDEFAWCYGGRLSTRFSSGPFSLWLDAALNQEDGAFLGWVAELLLGAGFHF